MKPFVLWSLFPFLLAASLTLAAIPLSQLKGIDRTVPNKFIIEVDTEADIPHKRSFARDLDALYASIHARDVSFDIVQEFEKPGLFVGASVTIETAEDVVALQSLPGVKAIYPVRILERPKPAYQYIPQGPNDSQLPPFGTSTHILTGVDKMHAKGILGKGIKIGILDTGIDYTHPNLGGGIGADKKIIGGFDFVGDDYTGYNFPKPDDDPLDQCQGHGTHVAGIIGTDGGNEYNVTGVAPESSLIAYRIFGCEGFTQDDVIIAALLRGVEDGADILTLSLGGSHGWTTSASSVVASRIAESGKIVTIAAGNDGPKGSWYTASPSGSINAISVGSSENTVIPLQRGVLNEPAHPGFIYFSLRPLPIEGEWPVYITSEDTTKPNDACEPLPDDTPDLAKFVTIVRRGTCTFVTKLQHIADKGGKYSLIYDNGTGFTAVAVGNFTTALIQAADGAYLTERYFSGEDVKVSFPQSGGTVSFPNPRGGLMSLFSTYGPTNDFYAKPALSAPGGNILSAYPVPLGGYAVLSGTSMATPFVAGAAALYLEARGKSVAVARAARTFFETTARTIHSTQDEVSLPQTVSQAGAGLINVYDALFSKTTVTPGTLILNDTAHFQGTHSISVSNTGDAPRRYKLSHSAAGTALTVKQGSNSAALGPVPLIDAVATVTIAPSEFTVAPGQSTSIAVTIRAPQDVDKARFPIYSGWILVESPGETQRVTYLGVAASLRDKRILDDTDPWFEEELPALVNAVSEEVQVGPANYTFVGYDYPVLVYRLAFGTARLRVDLVAPDIEISTTLNPRGIPFPDGPTFTFPQRNRPGTFTLVRTLGTIVEYSYTSRNTEDENNSSNSYYLSSPVLANGTTIPNGAYRILIRALRVTGNPDREEDYESWLSPVVGVAKP